uniref:MD-2-related lipid-recognition domain-containing protein n=1 Tax=Eutreptiella gymnastica TaxID=73025 RepID=A0A7S1IGJ7_9EUGL|mmetsp:Transcript_16753/g.29971  ORF Transcript_16753/g.29971 Transcript_16753/m.29971 type:complete len:139 (+) Transcript_16753:19-435(+)
MFHIYLWAMLVCSAVHAADWKVCQPTMPQLMKVSDVDFSADKPPQGLPWTITVNGVLSANITAGQVQDTVRWGEFIVQNKTVNFCAPPNHCPMYAGPVKLKSSQTIPAIAPRGTYNVQTLSTTPKGEIISCLSVSFAL